MPKGSKTASLDDIAPANIYQAIDAATEPSFNPFEVSVRTHVRVKNEDGVVTITVYCESSGDLKAPAPEVEVASIPFSAFRDTEHFHEWAKEVYEVFRRNAAALLMSQITQTYFDVSNFRLGVDPAEVVKMHVRRNSKFLRKGFGLRWRTGNFSPWTKTELLRAVKIALGEIPKDERLTFDRAAVAMRKIEERTVREEDRRAPPSGEALRKLLGSLKVDWATLKQEKRRVKS
jgi:hypothetical protein